MARKFGCLFSLLVVAAFAFGQTPKEREGNLSIAGRLSISGLPVSGVRIDLTRYPRFDDTPVLRTTITGERGEYTFLGLTPGTYWLEPVTGPGYVGPSEWGKRAGLEVTVPAGHSISGATIDLISAAAISGHLVTPDGQPASGIEVRLALASQVDPANPMYRHAYAIGSSDATGAFSFNPIPPGSYEVIAGTDVPFVTGQRVDRNDFSDGNTGRIEGDSYTPQTFYPGVAEAAKAEIVTVKPGEQATGIDVIIPRPVRTFTISGRFVDERTGSPVPNAQVALGHDGVRGSRKFFGVISHSRSAKSIGPTDREGNFTVTGLLPGQFYIAPGFWKAKLRGSVVPVRIVDRDVSGVEVKVYPALTLRGTILVEGASLADVLSPPSEINLTAKACSKTVTALSPEDQLNYGEANIKPDGSFVINGLARGRVCIQFLATAPLSAHVLLDHIESSRAVGRDELDLLPGENPPDVLVVLRYSNGNANREH